jgi:sulfur-carrier protein
VHDSRGRRADDSSAGSAADAAAVGRISVTIRYFAAARAAAGVAAEIIHVDAADAGAMLDDLLSGLTRRHGPALAKILPACSFLVDGRAVHHRDARLTDGAELDVLPPFAGG